MKSGGVMQRYQRIAVLGAGGAVGRLLVRLLLEHTDAHVVLCGRTKSRLDTIAKGFREQVDMARFSIAAADAADPTSMRGAFEGVDFVLNATTASRECINVARVCVEIGADYLEMNLARTLEPLAAPAREKDVALIDQAGFHPGLPAPLIRWVRERVPGLEQARIFMAMDPDFKDSLSAIELVDAVGAGRSMLVRNGQWVRATYKDGCEHDFGGKWGRKRCFPLEMLELREVAAELGIREAGVYAAGFNGFIDNIVFPLNMLAYKIRNGLGRRSLAKMIHWGAKRFSKPGSSVSFVLEGRSGVDGAARSVEARIDTEDAFIFTAAPVLSAILQYDDGSARRPGLEMMGLATEPNRLFRDLADFGLHISSNLESERRPLHETA